jgi:hypothetical protein
LDTAGLPTKEGDFIIEWNTLLSLPPDSIMPVLNIFCWTDR